MTLDLLPYQSVGSFFLASRTRAGLFDEPGVGKTAQAINALDRLGARRVIVVCPAAVRQVWVGEFKKFAVLPRRILKGSTLQDLNLWCRGKADVFIVSYEMATRWKKHLEDDLVEVLILDESHYAKSSSAMRTRALLGGRCDGQGGIGRWCARTWFLTGTPAANDPMDVWPFLRFAGATSLTERAFTDRYFKATSNGFGTRTTPRKETLEELKHVINSCSLRRTKAQAGLDLPPIWLTTQMVDGDTAEIRALLAQHPELSDAIREALERGGLSFLDAQHIATLRRLVAEAKAPAFVQLLCEELENGLDKVVVFGIHKRALEVVRDGLAARGVSHVHLDGSTGESDRIKAVDRFQRDPSVKVFVGNIRAAGTGITLTAAADLIMFESDWAPAANAQAIMRVHRIGQGRQVRARFIVLANSIDEVVIETVARKTRAIIQTGLGSEIAA